MQWLKVDHLFASPNQIGQFQIGTILISAGIFILMREEVASCQKNQKKKKKSNKLLIIGDISDSDKISKVEGGCPLKTSFAFRCFLNIKCWY